MIVSLHDRSHDHIGADRDATIAAASMHLPHSLFMKPIPPPQHYQVIISHC